VGRLTQAIELFELGLRLAQEASNLQHIASALSSLGWAHYDTGQFEDAIGFWEDALTNFRQVGDRFGEGDLLSGLGWVSYLVGAYDQALTYIEEGFRIFGEIGGQLHRIGVNIGDSGVIRAAQGDYELAIKNLREALAITEVTNSINERSYKGGYLAMALLLAGSPQEAEATARTALQYDVPANRHVVAALHGIALAQLGRPQDASNAFEKAKESAENLLKYTSRLYTARYARALALAGLGLLRDEPLTAAIEEYQRAKAMCSTAGVIQSNANLLGALMVYPQGKRLAPLIALVTNNE
jgi:tetratricopeptide (TPR) repeat protein